MPRNPRNQPRSLEGPRRRRATTLEELDQLQGLLGTPEGLAAGLALQLRPTDVVISPFAKCGTTWIQQIVHGLRTRGDIDFDDISRVIPFIEVSTDLGLHLDADQIAEPRAFKAHLGWDNVPKGGRYIVSLRHPGDALVSAYRFMEGWFIEPGAIPIADFARHRFLQHRSEDGTPRGYWAHLLSWWPHRHNPNVLLLAYEHMRQDLPATVRRIATFLDIPLDPALERIVTRQASLDFMTQHKSKFDDLLLRERSERIGRLPPGSDSAKVRTGAVGSRRQDLPPDIHAQLDHIWTDLITPTLSFETYEALLETLAAEGE